jgi:hypothetical protein
MAEGATADGKRLKRMEALIDKSDLKNINKNILQDCSQFLNLNRRQRLSVD